MYDQPAPEATVARTRWLGRLPLIAAACLILLANAYNVKQAVVAVAPRNAWEAAQVLEAWRSLHGMPIYEMPPQGHSTHMYGAAVPWIQGEIFRQFGTSNSAGRVLQLLSAMAMVTLLALTTRGDRSAWMLAVIWVMFLGLNRLSGEYFAENRPDMTAHLLSVLALLLLGYGSETGRWPVWALGVACIVAGFFFKQTAAIVAGVPPIVLVLRGRRPTRLEVLSALFPLALMSSIILGLKWFSPAIYHFMIMVPRGFGVDKLGAVRVMWELLRDFPLFLVLLAEWIAVDQGSLRDDPRMRWVLAILAVTIPFSAVAVAKVGGTDNSKLPALLAMMSFCALRLPIVVRRVEARSTLLRPRMLFGTVLAGLLLISVFPRLSRAHALFVASPAFDRDYWKLVSLVKTFPGRVVCPEDPTIPLYAKSYAGRSYVSEMDAHTVNGNYPTFHPQTMVSEIRNADYVVDVEGCIADRIHDEDYRSFGFEPLQEPALASGQYRIWHRIR